MRKNKFLLITLAVAGMLTACSKDEVAKMNQGNEISFRLQGGMPSKTTASTAVNVDAFVVYGGDDVNTGLFTGVTVARQVAGGFAYAPNRYYDENATKAAFVAYSPVTSGITPATPITNVAAGATFNYVVPVPDATNGNISQVDLLFAAKDVNPLATSVPLHFDHALSRVFITATNKTADVITIESLALNQLYSTGIITVPTGAASWSWTSTTVEDDYAYALAEAGVAVPIDPTPATPTKKLITSMEQGMMVLPQTTPATSKIVVKYGIGNLTNQTKELAINGITFEENKQYSINLEFTGDALISFTVTVEPYGPITEVVIP